MPRERDELLIVSVTPQNLERGVLWFQENFPSIKKALGAHPWWRNNALILEKDLVIKPSELARRILDFGYERTQTVRGRGLFAARGGIMEVWPVNAEKPHVIEFSGNMIAGIRERMDAEEKEKPPRAPLSQAVEKLPIGSFVVHADHGIGVFCGATDAEIKNAGDTFGGVTSERNNDTSERIKFFVIEYAPPAPRREPDRLFVPVRQKERLSPYIGFETPRVHRLGGSLWQKTKKKAREDVERLAQELLALYRSRHSAARPPYSGDPALEQELRATFPYEETEDQARAEKEIMRDLAQEKPMDRVLCGDVGFGKTELAIRAALRVISEGKQATVLSPTTVLAAQHSQTFKERLANLPVSVRALSRLTPPRDSQKIIQEIKSGACDCVIGTHRLLSGDIQFKNLGLLIIDEEQRFGVQQKEKLKSMRKDADALSLSATPIPRTLQFTLAKLRDISLLETPPEGRLPIQTFLLPYSAKIIREAVAREMNRGGQIYFLHNRVETIGAVKEKIEKMLRSLAKKPRIGVIHGRMPERELVRVMDEFRAKKIDALLATTIIENGLDIASANTLIADDATRLGLAQAHQLRGRIGRGREQAYAYFLYRPRNLTKKAHDRLEALQEYSELGAGYQLALRDLEIRGAGNILGREQSGAANRVGLNLYYQMLGEEIEKIAHTQGR